MNCCVITRVNGENLEERLGTRSERKARGKRSFRNKIRAKGEMSVRSEKKAYGQEEC